MTERWLPVPTWENLYEVSDLGQVRSLPRQTPSGLRGGNLLRQVPKDKYGHLKVTLSYQKRRQTYDVHWLVTRAFLGEPPPGQETRHGPKGIGCNSLDNLSYGTPSQNQRDRLRDKTDVRGSKNGNSKLSWSQARKIRERAANGESAAILAEEFNISRATIWQIKNNRQWIE